ncbi:MAG: hypothetical protein RLY57_348 [Candidatus Parcubacteria bacterium]|jgi:hypothetical protein
MKISVSPEDSAQLQSLEEEKVTIPQPVRTLEVLEQMVAGNEILEELLRDVLKQSIAYTTIVAKYNQILKGGLDDAEVTKQLDEVDPVRTIIHNATMDTINAFSRQLGLAGKDNTWVGDFGGNRAAYGKFAMLLALNWIKTNPQ